MGASQRFHYRIFYFLVWPQEVSAGQPKRSWSKLWNKVYPWFIQQLSCNHFFKWVAIMYLACMLGTHGPNPYGPNILIWKSNKWLQVLLNILKETNKGREKWETFNLGSKDEKELEFRKILEGPRIWERPVSPELCKLEGEKVRWG